MARKKDFMAQTITLRELAKIIKARQKALTDKLHGDAERIGHPFHGYSEWHKILDEHEALQGIWHDVYQLKRSK